MFTADLITQALGTAEPVYPISAAAALREPASADHPAGWDSDLADCAVTDLARAIAGHATRIAHGELDESLLTVAAARATAGGSPTASHLPPVRGGVLRLLAGGMSIAGIAKQLFVSGSTTKTHISTL